MCLAHFKDQIKILSIYLEEITMLMIMIVEHLEVLIQDPRNIPHFFQV